MRKLKHRHANSNIPVVASDFVDECDSPEDVKADYYEACDAIMAKKRAGRIKDDFTVMLASGEPIQVFVDKLVVTDPEKGGRVHRANVTYGDFGGSAGNNTWSQRKLKGRESIATNMEEMAYATGMHISSDFDRDVVSGRSLRLAL